MKKRTKRTIILGAALCLMIWGGVGQNSANAAYTGSASYTYYDGSKGDERQTVSGTADGYHYSNITFTDGEALNEGAFLLKGSGWGSFSQSSLQNSYFFNNAADKGGAAYIFPADAVTIRNVMFKSNNAFSFGGGLAFIGNSSPGSMYWIEDSVFDSNTAGANGGAVYINGNPEAFYIFNTDFIGNQAGNNGGAIYLDNSNKSSFAKLNIISNEGTEFVFRDNIHKTNPQNGIAESNAIYIKEGVVELKATGAGSKLTFDDGIQGFFTSDKREYKGTVQIVSSDGGEVALNDQVKNLNLIHKSGTLLLNHGNRLQDGKAILENVNLTFAPNGGGDIKFDLMNGKLDTLNINDLTIDAPTGDQKLVVAIDVDLNQGKSDFFNVQGTINGEVLFDSDHFELSIIEDGDADKFRLLSRGDSSFFKGENVQFNDISKYIFSVGEDGYVNVEKTDSSGLPDAVLAEGIREYTPSTLAGTVVGTDLGAMNGESLKVNMQSSDLDGGGNQGITAAAGQKLEFKNGGTTGGAESIHNFKTTGNGALANNIGGEVVVTDSTIQNNTSEGLGGAIYSEGGKVTVNANTRDVIFRYNTANGLIQNTPETPDTPEATVGDGGAQNTVTNNNDIYLKDATLSVNGGNNTIFESGIAGTGEIQKNDTGILKLAGDNSLYTGDLTLNGGEVQLLDGAKFFNVKNTNVVSTTNINLINNNPTDNINFGDLNLSSNANLGIDADIANGASDKIAATSVTGDGKIVIDNINISSLNPTSTGGEFSVITLDELGDSPLLGHVEMAGGNNQESMGPIYKYASSFDPNTGMIKLSSLGGGNSAGYNPAVLASPIATLIGGYLTQLNSYDMAFNNMDLYMLLTKEERMALKYANRYAAASLGGVYSPFMAPNGGSFTSTPYEDGSTWFKPYSMFEDVKLKNGPKVSNIAYGSFFGYDSSLKELGHGWDGMWSVYGGYNGSHQTYQGNGIYQNGGTLGATGMLYKGNFYTGLTANAGANAANADTMYGDEDFAMFMAGVAWKLGYNSEFFNSKLIIQPNYMMSYSFVDAFDYTNGAGVDIDTKALNALQFMPGLRIIGNLPNGWKPYLAASMVWTALDQADFKANDVALPELSIKPYFNYGVGLQKSGERFGGFFQTIMRAGGREGVFLQAGFNFAI